MQIIARVSVDNRTRALVKGLQRVTDVKLLTSRVEELSCHLLEFPETRGVSVKVNVYHCQSLYFIFFIFTQLWSAVYKCFVSGKSEQAVCL